MSIELSQDRIAEALEYAGRFVRPDAYADGCIDTILAALALAERVGSAYRHETPQGGEFIFTSDLEPK